jgi:hypothetical protein
MEPLAKLFAIFGFFSPKTSLVCRVLQVHQMEKNRIFHLHIRWIWYTVREKRNLFHLRLRVILGPSNFAGRTGIRLQVSMKNL